MKVTVAACQMDVSSKDMDDNIKAARRLVLEAKHQGAKICVLPELAVTGYEINCYNTDQAKKAEPYQDVFLSLAREHDMHIFVGSLAVVDNVLRNAQFYYTPQRLAGLYIKNELVAHENLFAKPGDDHKIHETPFGRIGCAICKDMLYKDVFLPYRGKVDLMIISSAWPDFERDFKKGPLGKAAIHNTDLVRALPLRIARFVGAPVVYCNSWGGPHKLFGSDSWMLGLSSINTVLGQVMEGSTTGEDLLVAELDTGAVAPAKDTAPWPDRGYLTPLLFVEHLLYKACGVVRGAKNMM